MKKRSVITATLIMMCILSGCASGDNDKTADKIEGRPGTIEVVNVVPETNISKTDTTEDTPVSEEIENAETESAETETAEKTDAPEADTSDTEESSGAKADAQPIVWLGDSLTQGSLGDDNDNLPNAPYEKLKKLTGVPVEGVGLYGYNTHDIFWVYTDSTQMNRTIDPKKTYIFWVGSNDWVKQEGVNTDTSGVIAETDRFLSLEGAVDNYIVIGTTARYELGDMYKTINKSLADKYGKHYLDVIDVIGKDGYGPDKIHLTQKAYDAVAQAVYEKLKELGYI